MTDNTPDIEQTSGETAVEQATEVDAQSDQLTAPLPSLPEEEDVEPSTSPDDEQAVRRGLYMTPRQTFIGLAIALSVLLAGLVGFLIWMLQPADFTVEGGPVQGGLTPVLSIYGPGRGKSPTFSQPMGVAFTDDGQRIYVADARNNRICVFDEEGKPITEFGGLGVAKPLEGFARSWDPGELSYPVDVAVDGRGDVYVADFYNNCISVFTADGEYLRRFPDPYEVTGKGGSGIKGTGIAVTAVTVTDDAVYATDAYQVFVFEKDGTLIRQFGRPGLGPDGLDRPGGIAVDRDGRIYVSDSNHNRIVSFTPEGRPVWISGRPVAGEKEQSDNPFVLPRGMAVLPDGSLVIADTLGQQLIRIDSDGKFFAAYGNRGVGEGQVNFPNDVDASGELVVVADRQNQRVQVVRLTGR